MDGSREAKLDEPGDFAQSTTSDGDLQGRRERRAISPIVEIDGARVLLVPDNHAILRTVEAAKVDDEPKGYL